MAEGAGFGLLSRRFRARRRRTRASRSPFSPLLPRSRVIWALGASRGRAGSCQGAVAPRARRDRKSLTQTAGRDPSCEKPQVCPVSSSVGQGAVVCECRRGFGGHLPVPRAEVMLPYWVPATLRPRRQVRKACSCPCHHFGGHFPAPRDQAVMPYWVPLVLRPPKKMLSRARRTLSGPDSPPDACPCYHRWRVCCDARLLRKWQQLQALQQGVARARGRAWRGLSPLLPLSLSLLALLQALLRAVLSVRHFFWV